MHTSFRSAVLALALSLLALPAAAETHLRIGLGDDPDVARSDAVADLHRAHRLRLDLRQAVRHRREARTSSRSSRSSHETSADGKAVTIKLRPGVKFHDGEPFDAEAAKYSLDRHLTMKGSFRKPELGAGRQRRGGRSADHQAQPQGAVLAAAGAAHRPRRHDGVAQGGRGGGRQVRACIRSAPVPTSSSSASSRTASWSRSSPSTGTRTTSSSTRSPTCRSSMRRCGWPTCAPARST